MPSLDLARRNPVLNFVYPDWALDLTDPAGPGPGWIGIGQYLPDLAGLVLASLFKTGSSLDHALSMTGSTSGLFMN